MGRRQKILAAAVCVFLVLAALFSLIYMVEHAGHDCAGKELCEICTHLTHAAGSLKLLRAAVLFAALSALVPLGTAHFLQRCEVRTGLFTPVSLKVQLNN